jgi:hypothetical protein
MWFYIPAISLVVVLALWLRRTHLYRHFGNSPGQRGLGHSGGHYEGPTPNPGQRGEPGPG